MKETLFETFDKFLPFEGLAKVFTCLYGIAYNLLVVSIWACLALLVFSRVISVLGYV